MHLPRNRSWWHILEAQFRHLTHWERLVGFLSEFVDNIESLDTIECLSIVGCSFATTYHLTVVAPVLSDTSASIYSSISIIPLLAL